MAYNICSLKPITLIGILILGLKNRLIYKTLHTRYKEATMGSEYRLYNCSPACKTTTTHPLQLITEGKPVHHHLPVECMSLKTTSNMITLSIWVGSRYLHVVLTVHHGDTDDKVAMYSYVSCLTRYPIHSVLVLLAHQLFILMH